MSEMIADCEVLVRIGAPDSEVLHALWHRVGARHRCGAASPRARSCPSVAVMPWR